VGVRHCIARVRQWQRKTCSDIMWKKQTNANASENLAHVTAVCMGHDDDDVLSVISMLYRMSAVWCVDFQ